MRFAQWIMSCIVVSGVGAGAIWMLAPGEASRLRHEKEVLARERFELQRTVERLTAEDRVAEVHVVDQVLTGQLVIGEPAAHDLTTIEFIELDRGQRHLPSRRYVVQDRVIYFDALVIKFQHDFVAAGDTVRGKSLALFRRIYGESQNPAEGFVVDPEGDVPDIFRVHPEAGEL